MTYRTRFRLAYMLAAAKWLHAPIGSERERKAWEQMNAARTLWHARKHDHDCDYESEARYQSRQPEWVR